jgi:molybdenum cofactor cytidylyltransferase
MKGIVAIVLAAGESKRMGLPKMLLDFGGKTMIERVIENVFCPEIENVVVVLGAYRNEIKEKLGNYSVLLSFNEKYHDGMLSSVQCGIRSVPVDTEAVLIFQGDQPFIKSGIITQLTQAYRLSGKGIIMPVCEGKRGHPLMIDKRYFSLIDTLDSSEGLRSLAGLFPEDVLTVETGESGILRDFDTIEDYNVLNYKSK